jgi:hypothetical protein
MPRSASGEKRVIGPTGRPLTPADLPAPDTTRWVVRRKAEVVAAVRGGLLSLDDACARYSLSVSEFLSWEQAIDRHGMAGLLAKRLVANRRAKPEAGCAST